MQINEITGENVHEVIELHKVLHPLDGLSKTDIFLILANGKSFVMLVENKIVGYICVSNFLLNQISQGLITELENICSQSECFKNMNAKKSLEDNNILLQISLVGIKDEHKALFPKLLIKAIKESVNVFTHKITYLTIFVKQFDVEIQYQCAKRGFSLSNFNEPNIYHNSTEKGLLMYRKISFLDML